MSFAWKHLLIFRGRGRDYVYLLACVGGGGLLVSGYSRFRHQANLAGLRHIDLSYHVRVRHWLRIIVGPTELAHYHWNIPSQTKIHWPRHQCGHILWSDVRARPSVFGHAMPLQVWSIPFLCGLDCDDDHFCCTFLARDQRNSFGLHACDLGAALVLASVCGSLPATRRLSQELSTNECVGKHACYARPMYVQRIDIHVQEEIYICTDGYKMHLCILIRARMSRDSTTNNAHNT